MSDFIQVSAIKKEEILTPYEALHHHAQRIGQAPPAPRDDATLYEPCDRYVSLHHVQGFYHIKEYGWIIKDFDNEYIVHPNSQSIIEGLCKGVSQGSDGLLISRVRQVIEKLDMLSEELKLVPRIGSAIVDLQHSFDQFKAEHHA